MMARVLGGIVLLLAPLCAQAALVEHWWNISYTMANPDGLADRRVIGVNGSWPPPPIFVQQNDTLIVHAYNGLGVGDSAYMGPTVGTGLHSHGNYFNGSGYYDGAMMVTQCPIPPGETLDYNIPVSTQFGTYWFHGHYMGQYVDGLRTALIIQPAEPRTDVTWDEEYTVVMADWYHRQFKDLFDNDFLTWKNPTGAEPVPQSAVIYVIDGNGNYLHSQSDLSSGIGVSDDAVIPFEAGKRYKIRLINMSGLAMFHVVMANHTMQVIETDAVDVEPYVIDDLVLSVAQRYSILVDALNDTDSNYAFMFYQDPAMYDTVPDDLVLNNTVSIQYSASAPAPEPFNITDDTFPVVNDVVFTPIVAKAMAEADVSIDMVITFDTFDDGNPRAAFNDITYQAPLVPSLFTEMSMGSFANDSRIYGQMTGAYILNHMDNVQLNLINTDTGTHPFHLHGHEFQVVSRSYDYTSNDTSINPPIVEGQANPERRDTVAVPPGGSVSIRFRVDNPGCWFFHCHIEWHMEQGLAATFVMAPELTQLDYQVPEQMYSQCAAQNMAYTGNVVGLNSTTDFKGEPVGPFPQILGWRPKAIGALAGCIITAMLGFATVIWYGWGELDEREIESEIRRKRELKQLKAAKGEGFFSGLRKRAST